VESSTIGDIVVLETIKEGRSVYLAPQGQGDTPAEGG